MEYGVRERMGDYKHLKYFVSKITENKLST